MLIILVIGMPTAMPNVNIHWHPCGVWDGACGSGIAPRLTPLHGIPSICCLSLQVLDLVLGGRPLVRLEFGNMEMEVQAPEPWYPRTSKAQAPWQPRTL